MQSNQLFRRTFLRSILFLLLLIISFGLIGCHGVKYEWLPEHKHEHQITPKDKSTQDVSKFEANILQVKF